MATATAANVTELDSIVTGWATGGGNTVTEESTVTLADGLHTGNMNIAGLSFPHRVWISGRAPASDADQSPVRVTGQWFINGTTNLGIKLIEFTGQDRLNCQSGTTTNLWFDRVLGQGDFTATPEISNWPSYTVFQPFGTMNGFKVTNSLLRRAQSIVLFLENGADQVIERNLFFDTSADFIRLKGVVTGASKLDRNWVGKQLNPPFDSHTDFIQSYPGTAEFHGEFIGNVIWRGVMQRSDVVALEGFFFSDGGRFWGTVHENIYVGDSPEAITFYSGADVDIERNTIIVVNPNNTNAGAPNVTFGAPNGTFNPTLGTFTRNIWIAAGAAAKFGTEYDAPVNTLVYPGDQGGENFATILPYYDQAPERTGNIGQLKPIVDAITDWDNPAYHGAATRLKEIIIDGDHPGNVGWPVAKLWTDYWNNPAQPGDLIASTYSGEYNPDGTNVTDAITKTSASPAAITLTKYAADVSVTGGTPPSISGLTINVVSA